MNSIVKSILDELNNSNIKNKKGQITCNLAGVTFYIDNRDILGGIIQSWFGEWMSTKKIEWHAPVNSQTWPDFTLKGGVHLEVKCFNYDESPGFDIANFGSYVTSLLDVPQRLNDDYIVFGYVFDGVNLSIKDYWVKHVWELTGPSPTHFLNLQVKKGQAYNIRPKNWRGNGEIFQNRKDFVVALSKAVEKFGFGTANDWLNKVEKKFQATTNSQL
jgi:type II restriction enzyme